jgi:hypothetical protein
MLNIKIFKNTPSNLYVGIYRNGMVSIYKDTMDYFPGRDGITIRMGDDGRLYFKFTVKDNDSFKIKRSKSGSAYVNTSKLFSMNNIDKNEYVGRYNLIPVNDPKYKGFYALEWVADPTLKKKEIKEFEKEVEKAVGEDEKDLQRKLEFKD